MRYCFAFWISNLAGPEIWNDLSMGIMKKIIFKPGFGSYETAKNANRMKGKSMKVFHIHKAVWTNCLLVNWRSFRGPLCVNKQLKLGFTKHPDYKVERKKNDIDTNCEKETLLNGHDFNETEHPFILFIFFVLFSNHNSFHI